jgi:hypothetical protein
VFDPGKSFQLSLMFASNARGSWPYTQPLD